MLSLSLVDNLSKKIDLNMSSVQNNINELSELINELNNKIKTNNEENIFLEINERRKIKGTSLLVDDDDDECGCCGDDCGCYGDDCGCSADESHAFLVDA